MPSPEEILQGLRYAANHYKYFAVFWHLYAVSAAILFMTGSRPLAGIAGFALSLPLLSVSFFALISENPFNSTVFLILGILLLISVAKSRRDKTRIHFNFNFAVGVVLVIAGFVYPHFLKAESFFLYLIASPGGILPCPTLMMVSGFTLILTGFAGKMWMYTLSAACLFYGITGVFYLGMYIDSILFAAAVVLLLNALSLIKPIQYEDESFL
jgi:hypothetical protein